MKIYMLTDLEGVSGVVGFDDYGGPEGRFHELARRLLTEEVNAAVEGMLETGKHEIIIWDGHGHGGINIENLHPEAKLIPRGPIPNTVGLDSSFDAMVIVGQHAMNHAPEGNLTHTYNHTGIDWMKLNGKFIGEMGIRMVMAGQYGIKTLLVTGDEAACKEAKKMVSNIETVAVKKGINRENAICLSPRKARGLIKDGAKRALERADEIDPYIVKPPYELQIRYTHIVRPPEEKMEGVDDLTKVKKSDNFADICM